MDSQTYQTINLNSYWQIFKRRWVFAISLFIPLVITTLLPFVLKKPDYVAQGKLRFHKTNIISNLIGSNTAINQLESVANTQSNPLSTETEVIRSNSVIQNTINRLGLKNKQGNSLKVQDLLKKLTIKEIEKTDILLISYKDQQSEMAAKVVNTLMKAYLEQNLATQRSEASAARQFIEKQLPNAELNLRQTEAELAKFKEKHKIVSLTEELTKSVEVIGETEKQINEILSRLADVEKQSQIIRQQLGMNSQQAFKITSLNQVNGVRNIFQEIQQLESQLATRRTALLENHPQIIDLKEKLQALNKLLQQRIQEVVGSYQPRMKQKLQMGELQQQLSVKLIELESTRLGLQNQANTLYKLQANYKQRLNNLPTLEQQQRQLERQVQAAQSTYSLLLQKLQESRIAENQTVGNASMMSPAEIPEEPSFPPAIVIGSILLSILVTLVVIFILEAKDKSIKTVDEAKKLLGWTLLGVLPTINKDKKYLNSQEEIELYNQRVVIRDFPRSPISEAYRMLRANLKFINADKELKVIVVTSSVSKEGKSTVAANLATAMAQMDHQVLLIDGDLHHPVQHKIWDINSHQGLSNLIIGQTEIKTAITRVMENLDVLTSGVVPPSPASLLDSQKMVALMEKFTAKYDFIIVDTPALNVAADAATLGQMADGVLLVVRPGVVDTVSASFAKELLEKSGQNVLGQVINGVILQNEPHSYYYFTQEYDGQENKNQKELVKLTKS